jgi:hypothetical protein
VLKTKWVMLCPMARSGSSHTSETLGGYEGMLSHHGLFNGGPFGRWPADEFIDVEKMPYYSSVLDENYQRVGGMEHSGEFLDRYIFTDDPKINLGQWECIGFKLQYVHFVHMPDLREHLKRNGDIKIILNSRRDLLEHTTAEFWCQQGNSRDGRPGKAYEFGSTTPITVDFNDFFATFVNLCRYREDAIRTFDLPGRDFLEWSLEDMFDADGKLNVANHTKLFDFLEVEPSEPFTHRFAKTPRPSASHFLKNYEEIKQAAKEVHGGLFSRYFQDDYDSRSEREWPVLENYRLDEIMQEKDNSKFRDGVE